LSYLGDEFYLRCKKKLERAEATKKDFNLLLDAYQEIEEKIRYQTNKEKTVSTAAMAKLSQVHRCHQRLHSLAHSLTHSLTRYRQAEEKKIVIKERLQQFGNATLERLQCINNEVNNKIVEHMCTYIEAQYEYFKEGFEEFSRAIPVISEFRNYIAKVSSALLVAHCWIHCLNLRFSHLVGCVVERCRPSMRMVNVDCAMMPSLRSLANRRISRSL